ncbi:MAG: sigma-70 family RNA polymerase sigma factor [Calditrichaeota bacterium]|nr:sigma-70 family RNA polymerase sigma factor [Calditrichota bacterium]
MQVADYQYWLKFARQHSRKANEAEDLLQDCLLIAVRAAKDDLSNEDNRKWFAGVIKKQSLMAARTAVRRKTREEKTATESKTQTTDPENPPNYVILHKLPKSAQKVIKLALAGLNQDEIRQLLKLSPTAFRQRLTTIRKVINDLPEDLRVEAVAMAYYKRENRHDDLALGLIRRALLRVLRDEEDIGSHDPDGHLLIFRKD